MVVIKTEKYIALSALKVETFCLFVQRETTPAEKNLFPR